jgi:hypothetical protein
LLADNREKMSNVIIYNCWSQYRKRLPIMYAKVTHLVAFGDRDGSVTKGWFVIKEQLKVHNCTNTFLNEPRGTVFVWP